MWLAIASTGKLVQLWFSSILTPGLSSWLLHRSLPVHKRQSCPSHYVEWPWVTNVLETSYASPFSLSFPTRLLILMPISQVPAILSSQTLRMVSVTWFVVALLILFSTKLLGIKYLLWSVRLTSLTPFGPLRVLPALPEETIYCRS